MYQPNRLYVLEALNTLTLICLIGAVSVTGACAKSLFQGSMALADTQRAVSFGERPSGSASNEKTREWIVAQLKLTGATVVLDSFSGRTPEGPVPMVNVIAKFPGSSGKAIAITGHFDTKRIAGVRFLGANDAGSSTGFLLEFARALSKTKHRDDISIVFLMGKRRSANGPIRIAATAAATCLLNGWQMGRSPISSP